ncbi:MAG: PilZ domain-containing protein [Pontixanthobacter sp.]
MHIAPSLPQLAMAVEERAAPRFTLLIRAAKLVVGEREYVCVVRDISASGASIRSFHRIPAAPHLALEFQPGHAHSAALVWQSDGEAGFKFDHPVDVERILTGYSDYPRRDLRFAIERPALLNFDGNCVAARLVNLSRQGGAICCTSALAIDQPLRLDVDGLPDIVARVRWRKDGLYGLVFDTMFSIGGLALIIRDLHETSHSSDFREIAARPAPDFPPADREK